MKIIPLTRGYSAIVDDQDYERVSAHKWYALAGKARTDGSSVVYAVRNVPRADGGQTKKYLHSFILGTPKDMYTDHANGDGLDNRRANLRTCSSAENQHNKRPRANGTSRFKGVDWDKGCRKWRARIKLGGVLIYLGRFTCESDAAKAYDAAALRYFDKFARPNFKQISDNTTGVDFHGAVESVGHKKASQMMREEER